MANRYITSHFPLFSILLFSLSFAIYTQLYITDLLVKLGLYSGMREFFSEHGIKLTLLFLLLLFFFMVFSALKLIADTMIELSMLFFSKDEDGSELNKGRAGSWIYLIASIVSLFFSQHILFIVGLFLVASFVYFIYVVVKISRVLSVFGLIGLVFFHIFFWSMFLVAVTYASIKLYNSFIASLPF